MTADEFIVLVLDEIEKKEARLLVWGLVDGRLTGDELARLIDPLLDTAIASGIDRFVDAAGVIDELRARVLLIETDETPYPGFRSRMAEAVRLLFRLRQLFPKHSGPVRWQQAATLVADFRFVWRRRRYPNRNITVAPASRTLRAATPDPATRNALTALLEGRPENFALAQFQVSAAERILTTVSSRRKAGTLVSAGTGSGKTLAFYLPALARCAGHIAVDPSFWVKVLAIYPRTELLRDQFAEIYLEARRLDHFLGRHRPIRIGCLFSATPNNADEFDTEPKLRVGWKRVDDGVACGYMACPSDDCDGDLVWRDTDRRAGVERLVCDTCGSVVGADHIALTRHSLLKSPPDIVFTTTEMLNQRMADSSYRRLFGIQVSLRRSVEMVLLDEVHYYTGTDGAQVAFLLRRWQHRTKHPVTFVGLSATLLEGKSFFAKLTGLDDNQIEAIAPSLDDMREEGAEHLLALRGDPVSRSSLLSTTIQTAMLMMRMLDHADNAISRGLYGQRAFIFTDDLDVNNRLYDNLLDAEGRASNGRPNFNKHPNGPLAFLRTPIPSRSRERYGQNWTLAEHIGHRLTERKRIGRTSSQDPGVAAEADAIVATASLEVGFNDPQVGVVIQHKAPRGAAPLLQRKGRAGRLRRMRPWTVVVLSGYGRDRLAFQGYDRLFDPELPPQALPLMSRHIRRIQAVYALIDYLGRDGADGPARGNIWYHLATPNTPGSTSAQRRFLVPRLIEIIESPDATEEFIEYLADALKIDTEDVLPLLWQHPRPLLSAVIPTAIRRLRTNWERDGREANDYHVRNSPLPEFAPGQLFGDLNLPEVAIALPPPRAGVPGDEHSMAIESAMRAFAPGRVSRRFGIGGNWVRHWVGPIGAPQPGHHVLDVDTAYETAAIGDWQIPQGDGERTIRVLRPYTIRSTVPDRTIRDSSNSQLTWFTQIVATAAGQFQDVPRGTPWTQLIRGIEAFIHAEQCPIEIRRFSTGATADIQVERVGSVRCRFEFESSGQPVALGFSLIADAMRIRLAVPANLWQRSSEHSAPMWRGLRTARYMEAAWTGESIALVDNPFARQWLAEIYLTAISYHALDRGESLEAADAALRAGTSVIALPAVLDTIFQSAPDDDDGHQAPPTDATDRLRRDLEGYLRRADVRDALHHSGRLLWEPIDAGWEPWLRRKFKSTVGAAFLEAIRNLCPDIGEDGLILDCHPGYRTPDDALPQQEADDELWISETHPGGIGLIEAVLQAYAEDPRRFYLLVAAALRPTEHEFTDHQLGRLLSALSSDDASNLRSAVETYRASQNHDTASNTMAILRRQLRADGYPLFHGFVSALANRVLRPGTSQLNDRFLDNALRRWKSEEARLGIEITATVLAYALSQTNEIDQIMTASGLPPPDDNRSAWRHNTIYGLLWPRGAATRLSALTSYNPFAPLPDAERLLVADYLSESHGRVSLNDDDWQAKALEHLARAGSVTLVCSTAESVLLATALNFLATTPVESEYLSVFARLGTLRRVGDMYEADVELAEFAQ